MTIAPRALALSAALLLLASACGGDDSDNQTDAPAGGVDAAGAVDGTSADARACTTSDDCNDPLHAVCDTAAGVCVQCLETGDCSDYFFSHVCDTAAQECVECIETADCTADPTALGPTCNLGLGYCECAGAEECADNPNGAVCDADKNACSCVNDDDCVEPATCEDSFYLGEGKRTCQTPK